MHKFFKWASISILSLVIIVLAVLIFYSNRNLKSKVQPLVQQEITKLFQDSAALSFEHVQVNFFNKKAVISDIKFVLAPKDSLSDTIAFLNLKELSFQIDNSYVDFFSLDSLAIKALKLKKPSIFFPIDVDKIKLTKSKEAPKKSIIFFLNNFTLDDGEIALYHEKGEKNGLLTAAIKIKSDSILIKDDFSWKNFSPKSLGASFLNVMYPLKDDFHNLKMEAVNVNFTEGTIGLQNMIFEPKDDQKTFAKRQGEEKTYIKLKTDSISISGWQWNKIDGVFVEKIAINGAELYAYKDKNYPLPDDRFIPILTDELRKSDIPIHINKINIENSLITYEELPNGKDKSGQLFFDEVSGEITNITNVKDSIEKNGNQLKIDAAGMFYGEGKLETSMLYSLVSSDFQIEGKLSSMQITLLNNFIADMFPVKVRSGQVDKVDFDFSGDNLKSAGELKFYYTGLEIQSQFKKEDGTLIDRAISKVGNFILPQNNPKSAEDDLHVGRFEHERDTRKSMFNFWATSIVAGFKATFGIDDIEEVKEKVESEDKSIWEKLGFGNDE